MEFTSFSSEARKIAGRAYQIIKKRNKGSYLFFNDAMTSVHALENREANMEKICSRKANNVMVGYYGADASYRSIERDIAKVLSEEKYKPVEDFEL